MIKSKDSKQKYPIYDISQQILSSTEEQAGSKAKEWISYTLDGEERHFLSKEGRLGTGENWAEKVASELADLMGLMHAKYEFGYIGRDEGGNPKYCVFSPKFLRESETFRPGNEFIEGFTLNKKFKNDTYTLSAVLLALKNNRVVAPQTFKDLEGQDVIYSAMHTFIGYLCFDAWIGNTDRHDENWGIIFLPNVNILAPTFDHASCLGRNESDAKRIERIATKDKGSNVLGYIKKAKTPFYNEAGKRLNTIALVEECKKIIPESTIFWINKIVNVMSNEEEIRNIFDKVPDQLISEPAKDFAMAMLKTNTELLRELEND